MEQYQAQTQAFPDPMILFVPSGSTCKESECLVRIPQQSAVFSLCHSLYAGKPWNDPETEDSADTNGQNSRKDTSLSV